LKNDAAATAIGRLKNKQGICCGLWNPVIDFPDFQGNMDRRCWVVPAFARFAERIPGFKKFVSRFQGTGCNLTVFRSRKETKDSRRECFESLRNQLILPC
jgi:hypothetical protein